MRTLKASYTPDLTHIEINTALWVIQNLSYKFDKKNSLSFLELLIIEINRFKTDPKKNKITLGEFLLEQLNYLIEGDTPHYLRVWKTPRSIFSYTAELLEDKKALEEVINQQEIDYNQKVKEAFTKIKTELLSS